MTWKIKAKRAKQTTEVISDDPKYAIFKADQWRGHGWKVWIEDINGNKVDEAALRKAADQPYAHAPPLNYEFDGSDYGFRKSSGSFAIFAATRRASSLESSLGNKCTRAPARSACAESAKPETVAGPARLAAGHQKGRGTAMTYPEDNLAEVPLEVVLGLYFGDVFKQCEESGMVAPFVGCAISPNGSVIALRMDGKSDAQVLAEHTEGAGFRLPMTIVVVDQKNEAAKITIDTTGKITRHGTEMERLELYKGLPNPHVGGLVGAMVAEAKKPFDTDAEYIATPFGHPTPEAAIHS